MRSVSFCVRQPETRVKYMHPTKSSCVFQVYIYYFLNVSKGTDSALHFRFWLIWFTCIRVCKHFSAPLCLDACALCTVSVYSNQNGLWKMSRMDQNVNPSIVRDNVTMAVTHFTWTALNIFNEQYKQLGWCWTQNVLWGVWAAQVFF